MAVQWTQGRPPDVDRPFIVAWRVEGAVAYELAPGSSWYDGWRVVTRDVWHAALMAPVTAPAPRQAPRAAVARAAVDVPDRVAGGPIPHTDRGDA